MKYFLNFTLYLAYVGWVHLVLSLHFHSIFLDIACQFAELNATRVEIEPTTVASEAEKLYIIPPTQNIFNKRTKLRVLNKTHYFAVVYFTDLFLETKISLLILIKQLLWSLQRDLSLLLNYNDLLNN